MFIFEHKGYSFGISASQIDSFCAAFGLLCVVFGGEYDLEEHFVVLNPSTMEFKKIHVPRKLSESRATVRSLFWFGYDCKIDAYKLVRVE